MFGSGMPASGSSRRGVEICVESLNEWKIQEIGYDGFEKYIKPPEFKDVLAKNAQLINWKEVVGNEASLDLAEDTDDEEKAMGEDAEMDNLSNQPLKKETKSSKVEPVAGPWAGVAKHLHQSLQEINVVLDTLNTLNNTEYMLPLTIAVLSEDPVKLVDQANNSKGFQLCTRRKALSEASKMMDRALNVRQQTTEGTDSRNNFFNELRKMRENWRVRKVNNAIFGDLGYRTYGPKFHPGELFDISRKSSRDRLPSGSSLQVQVPRNLLRRSAIWVSVQVDNPKNAVNLLGEKNTSYMNVDPECSKNVHWEKALKWAQESLICRDIFAQLVRESVSHHKICLPTENTLIVSLLDGMILKIEKKYYPFEDMHLAEEGVGYLNRALREQFETDQCKKQMRNQQFVSLPQTTLPENLDLRGPQGLSHEEITARMTKSTSLLNRLIEISSHYVMVSKVVQALQRHVLEFLDPQLQWKWVRSSPTYSILSVVQTNRGFENLGKLSMYIRIMTDEVVVITKEFQQMKCGRDMQLVRNAIMLLTANFMLNSLAILSKHYAWQILHANNNAFAEGGVPSPTFYACNQSATKALFVQFPTDGKTPVVCMKILDGSSAEINSSEDLLKNEKDMKVSNKSEDGTNGFKKFNYSSLFESESSFMKKMDNLLAIFRN